MYFTNLGTLVLQKLFSYPFLPPFFLRLQSYICYNFDIVLHIESLKNIIFVLSLSNWTISIDLYLESLVYSFISNILVTLCQEYAFLLFLSFRCFIFRNPIWFLLSFSLSANIYYLFIIFTFFIILEHSYDSCFKTSFASPII